MSWYTSAKFWSFVGGAAAAVAGTAVCKCRKSRELAVQAVAKGMQLQQGAAEGLQSIKDDAADLAEEARRQAEIDAERADRRAKIEARIREQVEAELEAEDRAAAEKAAAEEAAEEKKSAPRTRKASK